MKVDPRIAELTYMSVLANINPRYASMFPAARRVKSLRENASVAMLITC